MKTLVLNAGSSTVKYQIIDMDNGIACESVDPVTGECRTGAAFATCAGFLCHGMKVASEKM